MTPAADGPVRSARVVRPVGERAVLVECHDLDDVLGLHAHLQAQPLPGQVDVQAAACTVLLTGRTSLDLDRWASALRDLEVPDHERLRGRDVTIDVVYDGPDLDEVAAMTGVPRDAVVDAHTAAPWTAAFGGFAPGFLYLVRPESPMPVARRASPRPAVPAGSVALAAGFSAVYPRSSPGGWQLLGRTSAALWDARREPPSLLSPGDVVSFRAVREALTVTPADPQQAGAGRSGTPARDGAAAGRSGALAVLAPGPLSLVQDRGRPGRRDLGVTPSGAADRGAAARANRLVGNAQDAAVVETVLGGLHLRATGDQVLAVTGAPAALTVLAPDGGELRTAPMDAPLRLGAGESLLLGMPAVGLRTYVAVRGGVDVEPELGSRSRDVLSGLGPLPLRADDVLPVGDPPPAAVGVPEEPPGWPAGEARLQVVLGPRADTLTGAGLRRLLEQRWTVTDQSDRVGLRLAGGPLERLGDHELPSEGTVRGAVQVPPSGQPVVFLADHPVSGGYPVVAVVRDRDLDRLAQLRPGDAVRFEERTPAAT